MMDAPSTPTSVATASTVVAASVFRPRRSEDWQEYRAIIEQLYRSDQLKLKDVKRIMERDYNFVASEKQYKDRLAAWHVRKNIKSKEVQVMIRKQIKRAARGKKTAFRVGGQRVDSKRINRFVRRHGSTMDKYRRREAANPTSPEPDTPSDMSCYTPEPEEKASLALTPEQLVLETEVSIRASAEADADADAEAEADTEVDSETGPNLHSLLNHNMLDHRTDQTSTLPPGDLQPFMPIAPAFSPPLPAASVEKQAEPDPWESLILFQDRLRVLQRTLEETTQEWPSVQDDPFRHPLS